MYFQKSCSKLIALCIPLAFITGCQSLPAHNNTLIFVSEDKLGIDISATSTTGATPSMTIGYRTDDVAWVPLWANQDRNGTAISCPDTQGRNNSCLYGPKFVGTEGGDDASHGDAYSTFSRFNARLSAGSAASTQWGAGSLFATGVAAQNITSSMSGSNTNVQIKRAQSNLTDFFEYVLKDTTKPVPSACTKLLINTMGLSTAAEVTPAAGATPAANEINLFANFSVSAVEKMMPTDPVLVDYLPDLITASAKISNNTSYKNSDCVPIVQAGAKQ